MGSNEEIMLSHVQVKLPEKGSKVLFFRGLVDSFLEREQYASALFWADKLGENFLTFVSVSKILSLRTI